MRSKPGFQFRDGESQLIIRPLQVRNLFLQGLFFGVIRGDRTDAADCGDKPGHGIETVPADIGTLIPGAQVDAFIQNDHLRLCLFEDGWEPVQEHKQGRRFGKHKERHVTNGIDSQFFQFRLPERGADKMLRASGWITDGDEAVLKFHEGQNARPFLLCGIGIGGSETEKENAFRSQIVAESGGSVVHWRGFMFGMKLPPLRRQHFG